VTPDWSIALVTGLLGGFGHCLGMCGPLVATFSLHDRGASAWRAPLLYHAGRVLSYASIGAMMGLAGSFLDVAGRLAGVQSAVSVLAGALMLLLGLGIAGLLPLPARLTSPGGGLGRAAGVILEGGSPLRFFPLGLLFGFLPCGLSLTAFMGAAATGNPARGFFFALVFGLATTPALLAFGAAVGFLGARARGLIYRAGGVAVAAAGLLFIRRGLLGHGAM
jgi:uncharacterized protein